MDWSACTTTAQDTSKNVTQVATLSCIPALLSQIITIAASAVGALAVIFIIIAGIRMIMSGGDAKQLEGARNILVYAVLGLLVVLFAYAIVFVIAQVTGATCILRIGFMQCK